MQRGSLKRGEPLRLSVSPALAKFQVHRLLFSGGYRFILDMSRIKGLKVGRRWFALKRFEIGLVIVGGIFIVWALVMWSYG